jgi:uncharacterized protein YbaR (Trm112 family)
MSGKMICPKCNGNGYRRIWKDTSETEKVTIQCSYCNSQGEVYITEQEIDDLLRNTERKLQ